MRKVMNSLHALSYIIQRKEKIAMQKYECPELEVISFDAEDVIATSPLDDTETEDR